MKFAAKLFAFLLFTLALTLPQAITPLKATAQTSPASSTDEKARTQLRASVTSQAEAEVQRVETAFPRTEEAALAHFLRGYLRLQAKDYNAATQLLADEAIDRYSALGDYALYHRGQALQGAGRNEEAEREFRRLAQSYPTSLLAR